MSTVPSTQSAWRILRQGKPADVLALQHDVPVLSDISEGEVLIRIKSAALNPVGFKLMRMMPNFIAKRPKTAEYDFSGVVVSQNGTRFQVGDAVYGQLPIDSKLTQGSLAQYISIDARQLALKPSSISFNEAAGLSMAARTAIDALLDVAKIGEGQHVFVNGGSSAVGNIGIQIAKAYGCKVTTTCSSRNFELVRRLGADEVVDYTVTPPTKLFKNKPPQPLFDVIFDAVSTTPNLFLACEPYLRKSGIFVSTTGGVGVGFSAGIFLGMLRIFLQPVILGGTNRTHKICLAKDDGRAQPLIEKLVAEGTIKPVVDSVWAFPDTLKAYERITSGRAAGKVLIKVDVD